MVKSFCFSPLGNVLYFAAYKGRKVYLSRRQRLEILKVRLSKEAATLDETIRDIEARGVSSATVSTGDGQQSASNLDLRALVDRREKVGALLAQVNRQIAGRSALKIVHRMTTRW